VTSTFSIFEFLWALSVIVTIITMAIESSSPCSPSWTQNTTHALRHGPHYVILDHFIETGVAQEVRSEIMTSPMKLLQKLEPARTAGDVQLQTLLQQFTNDAMGPETTSTTTSRGDRSTFIPQHVRERDSFQTGHPQFSQLLQTIEKTIRKNARSAFDLTDTVSVQLAMYPGDGVSGYPSHCDVSGSGAETDTTTKPTRILTAVYYLTPADWSAKDDGGHLQLQMNNSKNYDVAPYLNRCLIFRSDKVPHRVLPSKRRDRLAITMWFYGSAVEEADDALKPTPIVVPNSRSSSNVEPKATLPLPLSLSGEAAADEHSTIFVSIASFRDSETVPTIQALFETAQFPNRVVVGLVLQYDPVHDCDIVNHPFLQDPRIRIMTLNAKDARGPCYARHLAQLLYDNEDYVLQIDSHMRFRRHWDSYLISQISLCCCDKAILTTYPVGYTLPNEIPMEVRPTILVPWKFDDSGMLRQRGRLLKTTPSKPIPLQPVCYAAGFNFCRGRSNIPQYPTWNVFFGEEVYRAVQFHQAGYQFFAPAETVVYHLWSRNHRPVHSSSLAAKKTNTSGDAGQEALRAYLNDHVSQDTWKVMGVNWKEKRILEGASRWSKDDFAFNNANLAAPDSLEGQVAGLETNAQALIQSFLGQFGN
jgi:[Skp1-protein]-hydroxyproline N-acetylglucosaminyltransferase